MKFLKRIQARLVSIAFKIGVSREEYQFLSALFLISLSSVIIYSIWSVRETSHLSRQFARIDSVFQATNLEVISEDTLSVSSKKPDPSRIIKPLNLNRASLQDLTDLPGIGEKTAQRILEYRAEIGKFSSGDQLLNVKGIGKKKLSQIRPFLIPDSLLLN
ncbi:MAG: helix-hairpin-helix domain-containing protein [Bacteroidetes bacterium]|nr:helix-hairpin-helix domain-containing protein [Bacteroidota bacterium]